MKRLLATLAVLFGLGLSPALADGTIDTISAGSTLLGTELIPMFQVANPAVYTTPNAIKTFINGGATITAGDILVGNSVGGYQDSSSVATITAPTVIQMTKNLAMSGAAGPANALLSGFTNISGTCAAGGCVVYLLGANSYAVNSSGHNTTLARVYSNFGGAGQQGGFLNFDTQLFMNSTTGNLTNNFYQAANLSAVATANDNGTSGTPSGSLFGYGAYSQLRTGATNWLQVIVGEDDLTIQTGASSEFSGGHSVVLNSDNVNAATNENFGFMVSAQSGAVATIDCAYCIGGWQGVNPLSSGATIMAFRPNGGSGSGPTITSGIDLTKFTFTGNAFASTNFSVSGTGVTTTPTVLGSASGGTLQLGTVSGFNGVNVVPTTTTTAPYLQSSANGLQLRPAASGAALTLANNLGGVAAQFATDGASSASTNFLDMHGTNSGTGVAYIAVGGADTNIALRFKTKGTGTVDIAAGGGDPNSAQQSLTINGSASVVNHVTITGGTTTNPVTLVAAGSDTNIGMTLTPKGTGVITLNGPTTVSGLLTVSQVVGTVTTQAGTTYTFAATDCGTTVRFTSTTAVTATIPQGLAIGCTIAVEQASTGQVAVNGSAVTPATLHSAHSYTKTFGQWAMINIVTESSNVAVLTGDGA